MNDEKEIPYYNPLHDDHGEPLGFNKEIVLKYFRDEFEDNYEKLTEEEQYESYLFNIKYGDLLEKCFAKPLSELVKTLGINWIAQDNVRNPLEEYNYQMSLSKDEDLSEETNNKSLKRIKQHAEWYELEQKQNKTDNT